MFERDDDDDAVSGGGLSSGTLLRRESAPAEVVLGGWADIYGRVFYKKKKVVPGFCGFLKSGRNETKLSQSEKGMGKDF